MGERVTHAPVPVLEQGTPAERVTQTPVPVLEQGTPAERVTHTPAIVPIRGTPFTRVTHLPVVALIQSGPQVRMTQFYMEVLAQNATGIVASDSGAGSDYVSARTFVVSDTGHGLDAAPQFNLNSGQMTGQIVDHIADSINAWQRDITRDARELSYSATDPTEIASFTANGSIDHTGWAYIDVPYTADVRITTEGSSVADTLLFLYGLGVVPGSGSTHIAFADDLGVGQEPTLAGVSYSVKWSRIDITLSAGRYYVCVLPKDGSAFDWTLGKDLLLSVRER
jgi:hypothetical protein